MTAKECNFSITQLINIAILNISLVKKLPLGDVDLCLLIQAMSN